MHENEGVFCEMSTDTAVTRKRLFALCCLHEAKRPAVIFIKIMKNNRNIN